MAEALAAGLALDAAKAGMKLVTGRVVEEITLACCGFKDQLNMLQDRFTDIQAFLEDLASAKYAEKSKFVNLWLTKLTDLAYSADELMDDYEYELLRRKVELKNNHASLKKRCSDFISPATNPVVFRFRMSHRIREILFKLDELHKEAKNNGIQLGQLAREAVASSTTVGYNVVDNVVLQENRKHAAAKGSEFIGRKSDEEKLLQMILSSSGGDDVHHLSTIAVVGIGGLGKTTLTRKLYEHEKIEGHFGKTKVWICVSEDFKVDRLLNEMVERLIPTKCDLTNTDAITNKLQQELKGKKFFLVLDDVWESNQDLWNSFKNALMSIGDLRGCVILITTRKIDVANKARALYQHKLEGLSEDEGWALLQQTVFTKTPPHNSPFDDVGRRIANYKCKGVPLAIKAIGGLLQSRKYVYEWESIENSELWGFQPEDVNGILPSLLLSYNHLTHVYVKQCFAYCAIFPKDFKMEKHQLITLWLAQGFLHGDFETWSSTLTLEMIGEKYFNILLNYSFLEEEKDYSKDLTVYKMHDLVHDLATYISEKGLLLWEGGLKSTDVSHVRHLVFDFAGIETPPPENFAHRLDTSKLRTISFWFYLWNNSTLGINALDNLWNNPTLGCARYIRTLILAKMDLTEVPAYIIGKLVHLRYLDLSHNYIYELPELICKLYQLQTLRIMGCRFMKVLPRELHRLENLRHIETPYTLLAPRRLRQLKNLQTLPGLELRDGEGWSIDELGPLDQLKGQMIIKGLEHVKNKEEARQAGLGRKDKILSLDLGWGTDREAASHHVNNEEDVLDSLEPHPYLESLIVRGFMGVRFPSWMMTMAVKHGGHPTPLKHLTQVELRSCSRCLQLPSLGQLAFLRILLVESFNNLECIGEAFYQSRSNHPSASEGNVSMNAGKKEHFQSLIKLRIKECRRLSAWLPPSPTYAATAFPKLETLEILHCPKLEMVPYLQFQYLKQLELENVGSTQPLDIIKYNPGLKLLEVRKMKKLTVLPQELSNCTNLENLTIVMCEKLECIPSGLMICLKELSIYRCRSLTSILTGFSSLRKLTIFYCQGLEKMPKSLEECTSLEYLLVENCPLIKGPIPDLGRLHGLTYLQMVNTGELMSSCSQWIPNLDHLVKLTIGGYTEEWDFNLIYPRSLRELTLQEFPNVKSLPQQFLPSSLQCLIIKRFDELEQIPEWICNLSSLQILKLWDCKKLKYLPSEQALLRLSKFENLSVDHCPLLKERYAKDGGPEWHKISHIPCIHI